MPSRMTLSLLYEMIFSKMSSQSGELKKDTECHIHELKNYSGLNYWFCGKTGIRLKNKMMSGFVFYFSLKHKVKNKIQSRCDFELYDSLTGQPKKGRNLGRALRIGEMERNSMMARDSLEAIQSFFSSDNNEKPTPKRVGSGSFSPSLKPTPGPKLVKTVPILRFSLFIKLRLK